MKIIKYEKKKNGKYRVYLEEGGKIDLYEDTIIKNKLLYKKEINKEKIEDINNDNNKNDIYNRCLKYIGVRIRSKKELIEYIKRYTEDDIIIDEILEKLTSTNLINDEEFARAFTHDKLILTGWGPYKIINELRNHNISEEIINKHISNIKDKDIDERINKQIKKMIKSKKNSKDVRNKIYTSLLSNGYSNEMILRNINKYNF